MENEKVYAMSFAKIYPLLVNKAVRKGRTAEEVNQVITWLTGYEKELYLRIWHMEIFSGMRQSPTRTGS